MATNKANTNTDTNGKKLNSAQQKARWDSQVKANKVSKVSTETTTPKANNLTQPTSTDTKPKSKGIVSGLPQAMIAAVKAQRLTDKQSAGTSKAMLEAAKTFMKQSMINKVSETNSSTFDVACKEQENFIRSKEARGYQVEALPRYWTNPKSQIRSAMNLGINIKLYETESKLRKAVAAKRSELKGSDELGEAIKDFKKQCENVDANIYLEAIKQASAYITAATLANGLVDKTQDTSKKGKKRTLKDLKAQAGA